MKRSILSEDSMEAFITPANVQFLFPLPGTGMIFINWINLQHFFILFF